mgnify:CR=1 FL=1
MSIHGGDEIIPALYHQIQEWPLAARGAIASEAVQALALSPQPQALLNGLQIFFACLLSVLFMYCGKRRLIGPRQGTFFTSLVKLLYQILLYGSVAVNIVRGHTSLAAVEKFARSKKAAARVTSCCGFGGGCINDTIIHLATSRMGFGGFGESGMGAYHGTGPHSGCP